MTSYVDDVIAATASKNPGQPQFLQAVGEVATSVAPAIEAHPEYRTHKILERLVEPERLIQFRVPWVDDSGEVQVNRGYRIQMNSALGPYKGGLRFHRSVNAGVLTFLAFEQVFKNALTTLPLGGGKGGSDFDPHGRSDMEVMRFCQSFMTELYRFLGPDTDVPAGDIGVGAREIGYLFGQYKRLVSRFDGVLTGKGRDWGGSVLRPEATGYGLVYFVSEMMATRDRTVDGVSVLVSGSGNVAQYTVEKVLELGGKPLTMSDSSGYIFDEQGIDRAKLDFIMELKNVRRGRISEYVDAYPHAAYVPVDASLDYNPLWTHAADCALPCATENEVNARDAKHLIDAKVWIVAEGANMPCDSQAQRLLQESGVMYAPGKASNAGGVAVSGFEMSQNSQRLRWGRDEVDQQLFATMRRIHRTSREFAAQFGDPDDYLTGANIGGFVGVADAMIAQGVV